MIEYTIWRIWLPHPLVPLAYLLLLLPLLGMLGNVLVWTSRQYIVTNWRVIDQLRKPVEADLYLLPSCE